MMSTEHSGMIKHIDHAIAPLHYSKMYRMHKYWARKPSNVVNEYIRAYSREGDVVLDPFNGSGVTVLEALKLGRKAIGVDVDPFSVFLTNATVANVDSNKLLSTMKSIAKSISQKIGWYYETVCTMCHNQAQAIEMHVEDNVIRRIKYRCVHCSKNKTYLKDVDEFDRRLLTKIDQKCIPYWVPDIDLQTNPRINIKQATKVTDLFSRRNLIVLSMILNRINQIEDETVRMVFKLTFSSTLAQGSKLMAHTKGSGPSWKIRGFWIPPKRFELNVWHYFNNAFKKVVAGKVEVSSVIPKDYCLRMYCRTSTNMSFLDDNSIDYIFTDPPYGDSVPYLELNTFWSSWLNEKPLFEEEIVITDSPKRELHRSFDTYSKLIHAAYREMFRVLKPGKYMTVTFHNTEIKLYNLMIRAAVISGFVLEKSVYQPPSTVSVKAQIAPYGSAVGDYYIRFRKPRDETTAGYETPDQLVYENIVVDEVKRILAQRGEPTAHTHIINSYSYIYAALKARGFLFTLDRDISDIIRDHVGKEFEVIKDGNSELLWISGKYGKFLDVVPLEDRVEASIVNILNRSPSVSFDEILQAVYTAFPNALTPTTTTVRRALERHAEKTNDKKWRAKTSVKSAYGEHNRLVEKICKLGIKCEFDVYGDVAKYKTDLKFNYPEENMRRIREIDVIWYKNNQVEVIFEVENSTNITEALVRGSNLEKDVTKIILIPEAREQLLVTKINEPMNKQHLEANPWLFIRYGDFENYLSECKTPSKDTLLKLHKDPQPVTQDKLFS